MNISAALHILAVTDKGVRCATATSTGLPLLASSRRPTWNGRSHRAPGIL